MSGENLRTDGTAVNDCHAEVLARRGFIRFNSTSKTLPYTYVPCRFLYKQCNDYLDDKETIFAAEKTSDNRLVLKPGIRLHLFINTAPCGDGRVFSLAYIFVFELMTQIQSLAVKQILTVHFVQQCRRRHKRSIRTSLWRRTSLSLAIHSNMAC